jgi:uncharacterized membrane protein YeaQ/YmgE (transglycosylase-associated protein family)
VNSPASFQVSKGEAFAWQYRQNRHSRKEPRMGIIGTIIIGLLVGIVAKLLMPGKDPGGFIVTILLGIAGSFVATWLGSALGFYAPGEPAGFIGAVIGAVLLLLLYRFIIRRKAT